MSNTMRHLGVLMAYLALVTSGCASVQRSSADPLYESSVQSRISVKGTFGTRYDVSQEEGERQLMELAEQSRLEDSWAFIRKGSGEGFWIDSGVDLENTQVKPRKAFVMSMLEPGDEVTFYHIHPKSNNEKSYNEGRQYLFGAGKPSQQDFVSDSHTRMDYGSRGVKINPSKVATCKGVFAYKSPAKALEQDDVGKDMSAIESKYVNRYNYPENARDMWKSAMKERGYSLGFRSRKDYTQRKMPRQ